MPKDQAMEMAERLAGLGIHAIWNFAHVDLYMEDESVIVENVHLSDSLMHLSYNIVKNRRLLQ
jgi:redox-sensing transcriptional repressor